MIFGSGSLIIPLHQMHCVYKLSLVPGYDIQELCEDQIFYLEKWFLKEACKTTNFKWVWISEVV